VKSELKDSPRLFSGGGAEIKDYGRIVLGPGEMVSLTSESGRECDVTATEWGFYLGPSLNGRLLTQGFRAALVRNAEGKVFLNAVEIDATDLFESYLKEQGSMVVCWLDQDLQSF